MVGGIYWTVLCYHPYPAFLLHVGAVGVLARGEAECYICLETAPPIFPRSARYRPLISMGKYSTLYLIVLVWKIKHSSTLSSCMASCNSMYYPCQWRNQRGFHGFHESTADYVASYWAIIDLAYVLGFVRNCCGFCDQQDWLLTWVLSVDSFQARCSLG